MECGMCKGLGCYLCNGTGNVSNFLKQHADKAEKVRHAARPLGDPQRSAERARRRKRREERARPEDLATRSITATGKRKIIT
jgi:hypothetical protein